jgi:hypothetical protein
MWIEAGGIVPLPRAGGALSHTAPIIRNFPGTVKHLTRHLVTMAELHQRRDAPDRERRARPTYRRNGRRQKMPRILFCSPPSAPACAPVRICGRARIARRRVKLSFSRKGIAGRGKTNAAKSHANDRRYMGQKLWRGGELAVYHLKIASYSSPSWRGGEVVGERGCGWGYANIKCYVACVRQINRRRMALRRNVTAH